MSARATLLALPACVLLFACAAHRPPHRSLPAELTVVTWNLLHGAGPDGELNLRAKARYIAGLGADLVFVQEIDERCERSGRVDQMAALGRWTGMEPAFGAFMPYQGGRYGLGTLSAVPVARSRVLRLPAGDEPRVALIQEIEIGGHRLLVVNVHLDWTRDDSSRYAQARALLADLENVDLPTIVAGDFNDVPESRTMKAFFAAGFAPVEPPGPSWNAREPTQDIDHVLARGGASVELEGLGGEVLAETTLSDHRPVRARLRLAARGAATKRSGYGRARGGSTAP